MSQQERPPYKLQPLAIIIIKKKKEIVKRKRDAYGLTSTLK
jgi:hypothetical protein